MLINNNFVFHLYLKINNFWKDYIIILFFMNITIIILPIWWGSIGAQDMKIEPEAVSDSVSLTREAVINPS